MRRINKMTEEQLAVFHNGESRGFDVIDARNYHEDMEPLKPKVAQIIKTPYLYNSWRVIALTTTSRKNDHRGRIIF